MSVDEDFEDAWRLPIGTPGPPRTWLVVRPPDVQGGPIGMEEARRTRSSSARQLNPDGAAALLSPGVQVPAEEVIALLGPNAVVGGGLRDPPPIAAGSADYVRGRAGAGAPFAPGGEPLARQKRQPAVDEATLQAWLQARGLGVRDAAACSSAEVMSRLPRRS